MSEGAQNKKTVVVADRRGPERLVLEAVLKRLGYEVLAVETKEALTDLLDQAGAVDLIVLDTGIAGDQGDDMARSLSRADRRVILVDARTEATGQMIGFIDLTEDALRGIGVRVPEIVFLANDLLFSRSGIPRRKRRVYGGYPATFQFEDEEIQGALYNLSAEGAFIETQNPPDTGTEVPIQFELPGLGPFSLMGRVTWRVQAHETEGRRSPPGMGMQFINMDADVEEKIRAFVSSGGRE